MRRRTSLISRLRRGAAGGLRRGANIFPSGSGARRAIRGLANRISAT